MGAATVAYAPGFIHIDSSLFIGESGRFAARVSADYDLRLTQQWILSPEAEVEWHSKDDEEREIGSGFSEFELGLRLRYEIRREFAPYLGVNWERKLGDTADIARDNGEDTSEFQVVLGIRAWF